MPALVLVAAAAIAGAAALLAWALTDTGSSTRHVIATNLERGHTPDLRALTLRRPTTERALRPLAGVLSDWTRRVTPGGSMAALERKLMLAGRPPSWPLERVLAAKVVLGLVGTTLAVARILTDPTPLTTLTVLGLAAAFYYAPDIILTARVTERQRAIVQALPDVLDQMTICMEAGLGFEAALARAGQSNDGPLAQEIIRTLQEIQVGAGRRAALRSLVDRTEVPDLTHFVTAIAQAENYGVPIARVLESQAGEMRRKRRQRAEEAARKLPLKLLFPLVLFVLPPLFVILIGPAAFRLVEAFSTID